MWAIVTVQTMDMHYILHSTHSGLLDVRRKDERQWKRERERDARDITYTLHSQISQQTLTTNNHDQQQ